MSLSRSLALAAAALVLSGCPKKDDGGGGPQVNRCEVELSALGLVTAEGSGAQASLIEAPEQLIGGQWAHGELGDTLLANDRIRVIVQKPSRHIGPSPYGGNIIDADLVRPEGPGKDVFGKTALLYSFGRTMVARHVEVLRSGEAGGSAVIAVTGDDTVNDFINVQNMIGRLLGEGTRFALDPEQPVPARITTYYVLSPGEQRVRMLTAFCNDTDTRMLAPVGDLLDRGGTVEFFNPGQCEGKMGNSELCFVDPSPWFGWQGEAVAYGMRSYKVEDLSQPEDKNALLTVSGVSATLTGGEGMGGLTTWLNANATRRPGNFVIPPKGSKSFLRDFIVGRDLGEVHAVIVQASGAAAGEVDGAVTRQDGTPAAGARVAVIDGLGKMTTLLVADGAGRVRTRLPAGSYRLEVGLWGHALGSPQEISVAAGATVQPALQLGPSRRLTVSAKDPHGQGSPGKVTVLCPSGSCPVTTAAMRRFHDHELLPDNVAAVAFIPPQGSTELQLPPGAYQVVVTRGPEYTAWPSSWPQSGEPVDLTSADASLSAVLAHVVETSGWMSADLHVHSVNSPDSAYRNELRVINFAAEGVDILCSTDHDYITDFAPFVRSTGAEGVLASMIGLEVTPFDWGHYNAFPVNTDSTVNGGAIDWAGGEAATLRQGQLLDGLREIWPGTVVQMNHPRGMLGALTLMGVDTPTLASHSPPEGFRMDPSPSATPTDTGLFTDRWDALEIMNDSSVGKAHRVMNDWFTFLSRGTLRTGTATSDTHYALANQGGYPRTYVQVGADAPAQFDPSVFAAALKAHRAFGTNGPFMVVTARKLLGGVPSGDPVPMGGTVSLDPAAGDALELRVEVQAPEWMSFDTLELYTHAPGREAYGGKENNEWPESRIHQKKTVSVQSLEPVVINGQTFRRQRVVETFTVTPSADGWYVVMLRSLGSGQTLFPLHFDGVSCSGGTCSANAAKPIAFSNPVFVDADGTGKYDRFPLLTSPPPAPSSPPPPSRERTPEELVEALRQLAHAH